MEREEEGRKEEEWRGRKREGRSDTHCQGEMA